MPEDEKLTSQDLFFAAQALRQAARIVEKEAADSARVSMRHVFEHSARSQDALAAKFDRIAKRMP